MLRSSALFCRISAGSLPSCCQVAHSDTALLATQEKRQAASNQDGRVPSFCLRPSGWWNLSQVHLRTKTLRMHQWGVNLPGACEALCHWRGTIEPLVLNGTIEPLGGS